MDFFFLLEQSTLNPVGNEKEFYPTQRYNAALSRKHNDLLLPMLIFIIIFHNEKRGLRSSETSSYSSSEKLLNADVLGINRH